MGGKIGCRGTVAERMAARHSIDSTTGCWNWTGALDGHGYGQIVAEGKKRIATHVALELDGRPRPSRSHFALHRCDNPACVNPDHLWWGTAKQNTHDMISKNRQRFHGLAAGWKRGDNRPEVTCATCGKLFRTEACRARINKRNFCNKACCANWQSANFKGAPRGQINGIDPRPNANDMWSVG